ncbi:MAG: hypothetical protein KBT46_05590 [Ruminococcus sp.]|nr:hypothetical protein [Candidatus Copronaster equi]
MPDKDTFMKTVTDFVGENNSDEALTFLETMSATYDEMNKPPEVNWEEKYRENDEAWRKRYRERFITADSEPLNLNNDGDEITAENITIEDLFKKPRREH